MHVDTEGAAVDLRGAQLHQFDHSLVEAGSLDRVKRVIKLLGMVNSTPDFLDHPKVINGCSELFAQVWGDENGIGARSAVGMGSLPGNIAVEIEGIFEIE